MPVPIHIEITPYFLLVLLSSDIKVTSYLAPVAPKGCPSAIAPPLGFTFWASIFSTYMQYIAYDANASLISKTSISLILSPHFSSAKGMA